jgi:hypothetical protein
MSTDVTQVRSRRALLATAAGGLAAVAAGAVGRPQAVRAGGSNPVELGANNIATAPTLIARANSSTDLEIATLTIGASGATSEQGGIGLLGVSGGENGKGVSGSVSGLNGIALRGRTGGHNSQIAVDADVTTGFGEGIGLRGRTLNGIGVYAEATGGFALQVVGRAVFNRSGKTTIAGGVANRTVSGFTMAGNTIVVATVQGNPAGVWVRNVSVNDSADTFTIRLNKAAPSGGVTVGFFIVN